MSLLYFHSPLPPAEGGIADYAFETLAQLKDQFDTVIIDDGDCRTSADTLLLPTMPAAVWRHLRKRSPAGLDIYHLGNTGFTRASCNERWLSRGSAFSTTRR